jgi:hypothetical protein
VKMELFGHNSVLELNTKNMDNPPIRYPYDYIRQTV